MGGGHIEYGDAACVAPRIASRVQQIAAQAGSGGALNQLAMAGRDTNPRHQWCRGTVCCVMSICSISTDRPGIWRGLEPQFKVMREPPACLRLR